MENLIISLKVVLPLFLMMALGYGIKLLKLVDDHSLQKMSRLLFTVFLPVLLFNNIYKADIASLLNPKLLIFAGCAIVASFLLAFFLVRACEKDNAKRGVMIQGIFRSNYVIYGLPVALAIYGENAGGVPCMMSLVVIPLFNGLAVVALEVHRGSGKVHIGKILKGIITNPLIIATLLGLLIKLTGITLPEVLAGTVNDVGNVATPFGLIALGASFTFKTVRSNARQLLLTVSGRLLIVPLLFMPIAVALGFRGIELVSLLTMLGSPVAVSSFTMARQMEGDGDLAAQIVVFTSLGSILTMFLWIYTLGALGLL
ncbi:MAG: AEC family transporter [Christensenellales bacterium]|jgi:predicted permease